MYYTNKDIRIAMIENDISLTELSEGMGIKPGTLSKMLSEDPLEFTKKIRIKRAIAKIKENRI